MVNVTVAVPPSTMVVGKTAVTTVGAKVAVLLAEANTSKVLPATDDCTKNCPKIDTPADTGVKLKGTLQVALGGSGVEQLLKLALKKDDGVMLVRLTGALPTL
jgi:uncharacterized metal-binding protein